MSGSIPATRFFPNLVPTRLLPLVWSMLALALVCPEAHAQVSRFYDLGGSIGFSAEGYTVSGISARRPPASARTFANVRFRLFGLSSGFNLTYSTEQSRLRQSMNRLAFDTGWDWGRVSVGDVSPSFSKYSLSGATLRGGLLELTPGAFHFAVTGGQAQRPVSFSSAASFRGAAFRQMLYAGRLGYGQDQGTHLHLIGVYGRDVVSSVDDPGRSTPAENLSLTPQLGLSLFGGRLVLSSQATASIFTQDVRTDALDAATLPWYARTFFTLRPSTRVSYAGEAGLRLDLQMLALQAGYDRVQPGFVSMGLQQLRSDEESLRLQPTLRLFEGRLNLGLNYTQTRNNLSAQLLSTLRRQQLGSTVQARLGEGLTLSGSYMRMLNENVPGAAVPAPEVLQQRQISQTFSLAPVMTLRRESGTTHTLSLTGSYQTMADRSMAVEQGLRPGLASSYASGMLNYSLRLDSGWMLNTTANVMQSQATNAETSVLGFNVGTGYSFFERRLTLQVNGGWNRNDVAARSTRGTLRSVSSQWTTNVTSSYRLPNDDVIRFRVRGLANQSDGPRNYRELRATLRFDHRF